MLITVVISDELEAEDWCLENGEKIIKIKKNKTRAHLPAQMMWDAIIK